MSNDIKKRIKEAEANLEALREELKRAMPERIALRRVDGVFEDHGPQVYTSTGRGYAKTVYVRADLYDSLMSQLETLSRKELKDE